MNKIGIPPKVVQEGIANDILTNVGDDVFELIRWGGTTYQGPWGPELLVINQDGQGIIQTDDWKRQIECLEIYGKALNKLKPGFKFGKLKPKDTA